MDLDSLNNEYFDWLVEIVCKNRFSKQISYKRLLMQLHSISFKGVGLFKRDRNRVQDGINLRYRFADELYTMHSRFVLNYLSGPCSVLEMMVALAMKCEETIMDNPEYGDRTGQWFWQMISSMGLSHMTDDIYNKEAVDFAVNRMLNREYAPNGEGGLFTIRGFDGDLREVDIWTQLCWYLDSVA